MRFSFMMFAPKSYECVASQYLSARVWPNSKTTLFDGGWFIRPDIFVQIKTVASGLINHEPHLMDTARQVRFHRFQRRDSAAATSPWRMAIWPIFGPKNLRSRQLRIFVRGPARACRIDVDVSLIVCDSQVDAAEDPRNGGTNISRLKSITSPRFVVAEFCVSDSMRKCGRNSIR